MDSAITASKAQNNASAPKVRRSYWVTLLPTIAALISFLLFYVNDYYLHAFDPHLVYGRWMTYLIVAFLESLILLIPVLVGLHLRRYWATWGALGVSLLTILGPIIFALYVGVLATPLSD